MESLVSIIIPIYKVEKYLDKCLQSVTNQTYKNLEIILVDDGSPDNCPFMCDEWAKRDSRVIVVHQQNQGLSGARNTGTKIAKGEYILYVDSDDWIEYNMIEKLYVAIVETSADMSICGVKRSDGKNEYKESWFDKDQILSKEEAFFELIRGKKITSYVWNKLFKANIIKKVEFPLGKLYEDTRMMHNVFNLCSKVAIVKEYLYNYFVRSDSITGTISFNNRLELFESLAERHNYVKEVMPKYQEITFFQLANRISSEVIRCSITKNDKEKYKVELYKIEKFLKGKSVYDCIMKNGTIKDKVFYFLARFFPVLGRFFYRVAKYVKQNLLKMVD